MRLDGFSGAFARRHVPMLERFKRPSRQRRRPLADLHEVVESCSGSVAPALVGHSWGAMLSMAYAAAHPIPRAQSSSCAPTFDLARAISSAPTWRSRMNDDMRRKFDQWTS